MIYIIGLEYICQLFNVSYTELADYLDIKKQNISIWLSGQRNIPDKYLDELEKKFHIDKDYYKKDLDEIDKLKLKKQKIINEAEKRIEYVEVIDKNIEIPVFTDKQKSEIESINIEISKNQFWIGFNKMIESSQSKAVELIGVYEAMTMLLQNPKANVTDIFQVLNGLVIYYDIENGIDGRSLVQDTILMMKKNEQRKIKQIIDEINYGEQIENVKYAKLSLIIELLSEVRDDVKS